jgi:tetratricopeptide (TPR) repeat protein
MIRTSTSFLLLSLLLLCLAQEAGAKPVVGMSKAVYDHISDVQEMFDKKEWQAGLDALEKLGERKLTSYERAHLLNMIGFAWYQLDDINRAMAAYRDALSQEDLPVSQMRGLLTTISQLALMAEDYAGAERYSMQLLALESELPVDPAAWVILAQARIGQENYTGALEPLRSAISIARERGTAPRENWLVLLSSVYFMTDDYGAMRSVLYELVSLYPREQYLLNLAALHGQLGDTDKQLALVESLFDDQRLQQGNHLLSLANLFLSLGLPYKAGVLLEREINEGRIESNRRNLELLSQAWYMAGEKEKAIPPLAAAAAMAKDGALHIRVARLHMDNYNWSNAETAAQRAIQRSEENELGDAFLLLGMAMVNGKKFESAKAAFEQAAQHEQTARWAKQWLDYIEGEQQRMAALQQWH